MQAVASLMPAAQMLGRDELGRLPINHVFSWIWCAFKRRTAFAGQVLAAHFLWGRLPVYTHTLSWVHCSFSGNAKEGGDILALSVDSIIFTTFTLRYLVCIDM